MQGTLLTPVDSAFLRLKVVNGAKVSSMEVMLDSETIKTLSWRENIGNEAKLYNFC